jgi:hypothetical protein
MSSARGRSRSGNPETPLVIPRVAGKGAIVIDAKDRLKLSWSCAHNDTYGKPNRLAHKLHKLVLTRWTQEGLPDRIRLGSLKELCVKLGIRCDKDEAVRWALHQIASTFVRTEVTLRDSKTKKWVEIVGSPYSFSIDPEPVSDGVAIQMVYIYVPNYYRDLSVQISQVPRTSRPNE